MEVVVVDNLRKRHVFGRQFGYIRSDSRKRKKKMRSGGVDAVFQLDKRLLLMEVFGDCSIIGESCRLCVGGPIQLKERLR
ncbi:unnamed protein product [Sphagnum troendelagicum]|uniref:Ribosomal protein S14 n=1 Tax=Sphagnum troendelagicum TaxID=128251 RepID=A0ABP0TX75_9BRYO